MKNIYRTRLYEDPYIGRNQGGGKREAPYTPLGVWPASWIAVPYAEKPFTAVYKLEYHAENDEQIRVHVSADERYILYLNGIPVGRGPERGDINNWFFETYDLPFEKGKNVLTAKVWSHGKMKAWAQITLNHGFILSADNFLKADCISTGRGKWQVKVLEGHECINAVLSGNATACRERFDASRYNWGIEEGKGSGWIMPVITEQGTPSYNFHTETEKHFLRPAMLPAMMEEPITCSETVSVQVLDYDTEPEEVRNIPVSNDLNEFGYICSDGFTVPPETFIRLIIDLTRYHCVFPTLIFTGGAGSFLRLHYAESLYEMNKNGAFEKGRRNEVNGKLFIGEGDEYLPDGGAGRAAETLWWRSGRYVEFLIKTKEFPVTVEKLFFAETRYPYKFKGRFDALSEGVNGRDLNSIIPMSVRALEMCSHETSMDCPYYEQLMYIGDTRLQSLIAFAWTGDDSLPKKAIDMFKASALNRMRIPDCAYPANSGKIIPGFCLWWVGMIHDYMMWWGGREYIAELLPYVRMIIDIFSSRTNEDGLIYTPPGWDFVDWVGEDKACADTSWFYGEPYHAGKNITSIFNLHFIHTLELAADLEDYAGKKFYAENERKYAADLMKKTDDVFWEEEKGMFADEYTHECYSEHAQILAVLCNSLSALRYERVSESLCRGSECTKTDIYYRHYLFEALRKIGRGDLILENLEPWFDCLGNGFTTTPEHFGADCRSDCHAWGAHPIYHYLATICGVRPASPGFEKVEIRPLKTGINVRNAVVCHPKGQISFGIKTGAGGEPEVVELILPEGSVLID